MAYDKTRVASTSEEIKANLYSGDKGLIKNAALAVDEYFRTEIRENGIRRQITPPTTVTKEDLAYVEYTDFPVMIVEIVGQSAGAVRVSFETGPSNADIHGRKTRIEFNRIMTPKYSIDKIRLEGYKMPLLDILYDLMLKDIMDCEDKTAMDADDFVLGTIDADNWELGARRYVHAGPFGREAMVHMKKAMFKLPGHLQVSKYLMNYGTYCDFGVFGRDDVGGDMSQDMFVNGVTLSTVQGIKTIVTTKTEFVPDDKVYIYTDQEYYGGFYIKDDVSMVTDEQDDIWLSFFAHETIAESIINTAGIAAVEFGGTLTSWENGK